MQSFFRSYREREEKEKNKNKREEKKTITNIRAFESRNIIEFKWSMNSSTPSRQEPGGWF